MASCIPAVTVYDPIHTLLTSISVDRYLVYSYHQNSNLRSDAGAEAGAKQPAGKSYGQGPTMQDTKLAGVSALGHNEVFTAGPKARLMP